MDLFQSLEKKVRQLRGDESGSVLLLSGMMSFLIAIMALYAVDTSQGVYNRITSQNATDAAAETAALWQARGLNVEQQLNDFHYFFDETLFGVEWGELATCLGADGAVASYWADVACCASIVGAIFSGGSCCDSIPGDFESAQQICNICKEALPENQYQSTVSSQILDAQNAISDFFPALEFVFASQAAQESGADPVLNVVGNWAGDFGSSALSSVGLSIPTPTSLPSIPNLPGGLTPYAMFLPESGNAFPLSLNVEQKSGKYWPWTWSFFGQGGDGFDAEILKFLAAADWLSAEACCATVFVILNPEGDSPTSWGWADSYYIGHPGYMTWLAGKQNQAELAGLGNISWLNPSSTTPPEVNYYMNQSSYQWYTGSGISSSTLQIPAFIGLASSQTEGTGVTAEDESLLSEIGNIIGNFSDSSAFSNLGNDLGPLVGMVPIDSTPHLIGVYLPPNGTAGTKFFIYH